MPKLVIDGRTIEVERGTNLIDAGLEVGVQIPHYCYHPRLSVVGQCRMCLVKIEGAPKLAAACSTPIERDMVVSTGDPEVVDAQRGMMELLLVNHPLDCPICDQAGECGLQDYAFKHGSSFSRFEYEEKRTYPGRERIPLGPNVVLNMNRCIQCTRCVRFTQEITEGGELGFFQRGARAEIGTFPGRELDHELSTCVVDLCPVGALTSTRFRFADRVWNLEKGPSVCPGCDVGCNVTYEHRRGRIRRVKPRLNPAVNDYWMCDHGRALADRWHEDRLGGPRRRRAGRQLHLGWREAMAELSARFRTPLLEGVRGFVGTGRLTIEEAFLLARLADAVASVHRVVLREDGPRRSIPRPAGPITGRDGMPNRRGVALAGFGPDDPSFSTTAILDGDAAAACEILFVADGADGRAARDPRTVARLRRAGFLVVCSTTETELTEVADLVLPVCAHPERAGTFVSVEGRLQRFDAVFRAPGEARPLVTVLAEVLTTFEARYGGLDHAGSFDLLAAEVPAFRGLSWSSLPAAGIPLERSGAEGSGR